MPPGEIPWRAWRIVRGLAEKYRRWPRAEKVRIKSVWSGPCCVADLRAHRPAFPHCPDDSILANLPEEWREDCSNEAEDLTAHRFSFFAFESKPLGETIEWNRDYSTGITAPLEYSPSLDYRHSGRVGDVKYAWELARMQHLPRLGQAWLLTRDQRFAGRIVDDVTAWITQCPYMMGIHWTSPMEAALRLISWTYAFQYICDWEHLDDRFCQLLVRSIHQHLTFIDRNYSLHSSANNHLIAEASGVYLAATYWSRLKGAASWRLRARKHLIRECLRQNYPDGVNKEQSFSYQFFVWDLLCFPALAEHATKEEFPPAYWNRLKKMAEFLAWVSDCEGHTPNVGDEDDGIVVDFGGDKRRPVVGLMNVAARLWQRDDFRAWSRSATDTKEVWVVDSLYSQPPQSEDYATRAATRTSRSFPDGGYFVLRNGGTVADEVLLLFDAGPLGWPATAAHGHADALGILLHLGGQPVFIDPGTYSYQDLPGRRYFRATSQHNTLCFGHRDQGQYLNRFMWGKRPIVLMHNSSLDVRSDSQTVDGEVIWWEGANHRRKIELLPELGSIRIEDAWNGPEPPTIHFCLSPDVTATLDGSSCMIDARRGRMKLLNEQGSMTLEEVMVSPHAYQLQATNRLTIRLGETVGCSVTNISWLFA